MQKCFAEGSGPVYRDVIAWLQSSNPQLQLSGALAIANFARNGKIGGVHLRFTVLTRSLERKPCSTGGLTQEKYGSSNRNIWTWVFDV